MEGPERNCIYWSHRGRFDFLFAGGTAIVGTMGDPDRQNGPVHSSYRCLLLCFLGFVAGTDAGVRGRNGKVSKEVSVYSSGVDPSGGGQHRAGCGEFVPVKIAVGGR